MGTESREREQGGMGTNGNTVKRRNVGACRRLCSKLKEEDREIERWVGCWEWH